MFSAFLLEGILPAGALAPEKRKEPTKWGGLPQAISLPAITSPAKSCRDGEIA